jgi:hypothetical protein
MPAGTWHGLTEFQVECTERFVQEQDGGSVDQRPGEGDPLPLAARKLGRLATTEALQSDED